MTDKSNKIMAYLLIGILCTSTLSYAGEKIRVRVTTGVNMEFARGVINRLAEENPALAKRIDLDLCPPGFAPLAMGECEILVIERFPSRTNRELERLPAGTFIRANVAAQQRVLVVVHKTNPIDRISFGQITKILEDSKKPVSWTDLKSKGGTVNVYLEPARSHCSWILRSKCLKKTDGGNSLIRNIREGVEYCNDGKSVVKKVSQDRKGIGFVLDSDLSLKTVKVLAVVNQDGQFIPPEPGPVLQEYYPLGRLMLVYSYPRVPEEVKGLCKYFCGPALTVPAEKMGFTTKGTVVRKNRARREKLFKSGKGIPIGISGPSHYSDFVTELSRIFSLANTPVKVDYASAGSSHQAVGKFLAKRDLLFLDNPPDKKVMKVFGGKWEDAMPVPFVLPGRSLAVVVSNVNPIDSITLAQLRQIYSGKVGKWEDASTLQGKLKSTALRKKSVIHIGLSLRGMSGKLFASKVMDGAKVKGMKVGKSSKEVLSLIARQPGAIGFIDSVSLPADISKANIKVLRIGEPGKGLWPRIGVTDNGGYPLSAKLYLYVRPTSGRVAKKFVRLILTGGRSEHTVFQPVVSEVKRAFGDNGLFVGAP